MARITADVSAADAHMAIAELRARADVLRAAGDVRTRDQITADELCDRLDVPALTSARCVGVQLVMSAEMLVGADVTTPPHLVGYGPITPATASRLLAEADGDVLLRRVYADPWTNTVVAMDSTDIVFNRQPAPPPARS